MTHGDHPCRARGCTEIVPQHLLMCRTHWNKVPHHDKKAIYAAWDRLNKTPNSATISAYNAITRRVIGELAFSEQAAAHGRTWDDPAHCESSHRDRGMRSFFDGKRTQ